MDRFMILWNVVCSFTSLGPIWHKAILLNVSKTDKHKNMPTGVRDTLYKINVAVLKSRDQFYIDIYPQQKNNDDANYP